ncbi:MAG: hypothetical protein V7K32_09735 [Nostoc sp.]|uniref:hypothetical protein n=1 Tax=Nostoc sp. TaxID=1180 RepID=UPI002FFB810A
MKAKKVKIKTRPEITDELIHDYLTQFGLIENYYIWGTPKLNIGIIYCLSFDNKIVTFLVEDDQLNGIYIRYLEKMGVPIFEDSLECNEYGKALLEKANKKDDSLPIQPNSE